MKELFENHKSAFIVGGVLILAALFLFITNFKPGKTKSFTEEDVKKVLSEVSFTKPFEYNFILKDVMIMRNNNAKAVFSVDAKITGKSVINDGETAYSSMNSNVHVETIDKTTETSLGSDDLISSSEDYYYYDKDKNLNYIYSKDTERDVWYFVESEPSEDINTKYDISSLITLLYNTSTVKYHSKTKQYEFVSEFKATNPYLVDFINTNATNVKNDPTLTAVANIVNKLGDNLAVKVTVFFDEDRKIVDNTIYIDFSSSNTGNIIQKYFFPEGYAYSSVETDNKTEDFSLTIKFLPDEEIVIPDEVKNSAISYKDYCYKYFSEDSEWLDILFDEEDTAKTTKTPAEEPKTQENTSKFNEDDVFLNLYGGDDNEELTEEQMEGLREELDRIKDLIDQK